MRKCKFSGQEIIDGQEKFKQLVLEKATFHHFGSNGAIALIEDKEGQVHTVFPRGIQFTDAPSPMMVHSKKGTQL